MDSIESYLSQGMLLGAIIAVAVVPFGEELVVRLARATFGKRKVSARISRSENQKPSGEVIAAGSAMHT